MDSNRMINTETELLALLHSFGVNYQRIAHPPVYTCAQADLVSGGLPGVSTKNLFLSDHAGHFFLVLTACEKRLDLKALAKALGVVGRLSFGSEAELQSLLGITPGAVTVLALVNDPQHRVQLVVDAEIWQGDCFLCHPLVNTATLALAKQDFERFLAAIGANMIIWDGLAK
jgi:Ala-tRNA(Pro) deacylase